MEILSDAGLGEIYKGKFVFLLSSFIPVIKSEIFALYIPYPYVPAKIDSPLIAKDEIYK